MANEIPGTSCLSHVLSSSLSFSIFPWWYFGGAITIVMLCVIFWNVSEDVCWFNVFNEVSLSRYFSCVLILMCPCVSTHSNVLWSRIHALAYAPPMHNNIKCNIFFKLFTLTGGSQSVPHGWCCSHMRFRFVLLLHYSQYEGKCCL